MHTLPIRSLRSHGASTYSCQIQAMRPKPCRVYPISYEQMKNDGCEIIGELRRAWHRCDRLAQASMSFGDDRS